jgi:pilus assembly protein Flp/PilA
MRKRLDDFRRDWDGTTAIEYAFIASLVAVAAFAVLVDLGDTIDLMFGTVSNGLNNSVSAAIGG